jgi:hypothetical protein
MQKIDKKKEKIGAKTLDTQNLEKQLEQTNSELK